MFKKRLFLLKYNNIKYNNSECYSNKSNHFKNNFCQARV